MEAPRFLLSFLFLFSILVAGHEGVRASNSSLHHHRHLLHDKQRKGFWPTKLFVFGDSYVDTGNIGEGMTWKEPYGMNFPGKPDGRFSDGLILTDYIAEFYGLQSPVGYRCMKDEPNLVPCGMNFAYGGSGVFNTSAPHPTMTTQIDFFQKLLDDGVYNKSDLQSSLFLLTNGGNDYNFYTSKGGTPQGIKVFIKKVINQLVLNLKRLQEMGGRKFAVANLEPMGCLPKRTVNSSFQQCNNTEDNIMNLHNKFLHQNVAKLNKKSKKNGSSFVILDIFSSFTTILQNKGDLSENFKFEKPLKPCCIGMDGKSCGSVNANGEKMYTLCDDTKSAFFWDKAHPTQAGWAVVFTTLKPTLKQIC